MESQTLKTFLQLHLATDALATTHLPFVLSSLTADALAAHSHTPKWTARISSLLYSKEPGARWAGLCLATETARHSRDIMLECAQSWLAVALPLLSKNEPVPTLKASVRLLQMVYTSTLDLAEFQRQVVLPNVPKTTPVLLSTLTNHGDESLKIVCFESLTYLVTVFPTLSRPVQAQLYVCCNQNLNAPRALPTIVSAASSLLSALHLISGKVGGSTQWRRSLDEGLAKCWTAVAGLRTSFRHENANNAIPLQIEDPLTLTPCSLRLFETSVQTVICLLRTLAVRPVQIPIGPIAQLCIASISCSDQESAKDPCNPSTRAVELAAIPAIWQQGCLLAQELAVCVGHHLSPQASAFLTILAHRLEQPLHASQRIHFLDTISPLLEHCHPPHNPLLPTRLSKATLPSITNMLGARPEVTPGDASSTPAAKGKKRARGFEGDELFRGKRRTICRSSAEGECALAAVQAIEGLLQRTTLTPTMHSICARVLLSLHLSLPQIDPSLLAKDFSLHHRLQAAVLHACTGIAFGTTDMLSKSMGLVLKTSNMDGQRTRVLSVATECTFELLLHPRLPPLLRSLPHVESLVLYRGEEGEEEAGIRKALHISTIEPLPAGFAAHEPPRSQWGSSSTSLLYNAPYSTSGILAVEKPAPLVPVVQPQASSQQRAQQTPPSQQVPQTSVAPVPPSTGTDPREVKPVQVNALSTTVDQPLLLQAQVLHQPTPSRPIPALEVITSTSGSAVRATEPDDLNLDAFMVEGDGDEDEEIPEIDLGSDSDVDDQMQS